jgi:hypothetical protein
VLNRDLYAFFARRRGLAFAARSVPLHWFYAWYCGLAVPLMLLAQARGAAASRPAFPAPVREDDASG